MAPLTSSICNVPSVMPVAYRMFMAYHPFMRCLVSSAVSFTRSQKFPHLYIRLLRVDFLVS